VIIGLLLAVAMPSHGSPPKQKVEYVKHVQPSNDANIIKENLFCAEISVPEVAPVVELHKVYRSLEVLQYSKNAYLVVRQKSFDQSKVGWRTYNI